ncbi:uncharacterized protein [Typha latifolia]|uniref:uncharacterized protein n=1 Tax=Typha latifolia TaxID=4733 RepID=UPI003C2F6D22
MMLVYLDESTLTEYLAPGFRDNSFCCISLTEESWHPTSDTTNVDYWLNWRAVVSAIWVLSSIVIASILIWKYEGSHHHQEEEEIGSQGRRVGTLYDDESWRPCLNGIHPAWLLAFRVASFSILLALLIVDIRMEGTANLYYYTDWTLMLVTIYFALGSLLSIYGCRQISSKKVSSDEIEFRSTDVHPSNDSESHQNIAQKIAGFWGYLFQIIYQINAGAVVLTDCVFWFIILPFLAIKDYDLSFVLFAVHSANAILFLGDTALNSLRFPWFRIAYFLIWTAIYVIFQWLIHAIVALRWPYPFLDLSSPRAPFWYLGVTLLHFPCYAMFPLIMRLKGFLFTRWFQSYHSME